MSKTVKLSDALVRDARLAGQVMQRSIAGQVEYWARLGAIDSILNGAQARAASRRGAAHSLSELLAEVETPPGGNGWPITVRACHSLTTCRTLSNWD